MGEEPGGGERRELDEDTQPLDVSREELSQRIRTQSSRMLYLLCVLMQCIQYYAYVRTVHVLLMFESVIALIVL